MNTDLHNLSRIVNTSSGYLRFNRSTGNLQTNGSNFLSRLVVWIRFKTSSNYRSSIVDAKRQVMASMLSDSIHGDDFRQKIEGLDRRHGFFFNDKPLSARKVRHFINDVTQGGNQAPHRRSFGRKSNEDLSRGLVDWVCGRANTIASGEAFEDNLHAMLSEKLQNERGIEAADVDLKGVGDEIHQAALSDREGMMSVTDGSQATVHVNKAMSRILDERIADSRAINQTKLYKRLSVSGLFGAEMSEVNAEIAASKIATMDELDQRVNRLVVLKVDGEFPQLLKQAQAEKDFSGPLAQLSEVRAQLREELTRQTDHRMLSVEHARNKAGEMLNRWVESKQQAFEAAQESQHTSIVDVLTQLVLQEPRTRKEHIQSFRQTIEQTLNEIYEKNRSDYEALNVSKTKLFSMLYKFDRHSVLFDRLRNSVRETQATSSLFENDVQQVADIRGVAQKYIESVSKPMTRSYAKVLSLRTKIPDHICRTMLEKVGKGYVWEPKFIAAANGMHIANLTKKDNAGLYELLDSPQVARKRIGNREDFVSFSLEDLLKSMLGSKNADNYKKRRQAIDRVVPDEIKIKLLNELDRQLLMVQSRVMDEEDANALFQRGAVRFLRAQNINFEAMTAKQ